MIAVVFWVLWTQNFAFVQVLWRTGCLGNLKESGRWNYWLSSNNMYSSYAILIALLFYIKPWQRSESRFLFNSSPRPVLKCWSLYGILFPRLFIQSISSALYIETFFDVCIYTEHHSVLSIWWQIWWTHDRILHQMLHRNMHLGRPSGLHDRRRNPPLDPHFLSWIGEAFPCSTRQKYVQLTAGARRGIFRLIYIIPIKERVKKMCF